MGKKEIKDWVESNRISTRRAWSVVAVVGLLLIGAFSLLSDPVWELAGHETTPVPGVGVSLLAIAFVAMIVVSVRLTDWRRLGSGLGNLPILRVVGTSLIVGVFITGIYFTGYIDLTGSKGFRVHGSGPLLRTPITILLVFGMVITGLFSFFDTPDSHRSLWKVNCIGLATSLTLAVLFIPVHFGVERNLIFVIAAATILLLNAELIPGVGHDLAASAEEPTRDLLYLYPFLSALFLFLVI